MYFISSNSYLKNFHHRISTNRSHGLIVKSIHNKLHWRRFQTRDCTHRSRCNFVCNKWEYHLRLIKITLDKQFIWLLRWSASSDCHVSARWKCHRAEVDSNNNRKRNQIQNCVCHSARVFCKISTHSNDWHFQSNNSNWMNIILITLMCFFFRLSSAECHLDRWLIPLVEGLFRKYAARTKLDQVNCCGFLCTKTVSSFERIKPTNMFRTVHGDRIFRRVFTTVEIVDEMSKFRCRYVGSSASKLEKKIPIFINGRSILYIFSAHIWIKFCAFICLCTTLASAPKFMAIIERNLCKCTIYFILFMVCVYFYEHCFNILQIESNKLNAQHHLSEVAVGLL